MFLLTKPNILKHVSKTDSTTIVEIADRLGLPQVTPDLVGLIFKLCREGILEFREIDKSVVRSTKMLKFPENAYPPYQCRSQIRSYVREYINGTEFWLYCGECEASGFEGIQEYKIPQLRIPHSILSKWLSHLNDKREKLFDY